MAGNTQAAPGRDIMVDPFDLTFVWPLRLGDSDSGTGRDREMVRAALTGSWTEIEDLVRRTPPRKPDDKDKTDEMEGYAYAEMVYFHPFVQHFLYGRKDSIGDLRHFDLYRMANPGKQWQIREKEWVEDFDIQEVLFHSFDGGIAFLTVRLKAPQPVTMRNARNTISLLRTAYFQHYFQVAEKVAKTGGEKVVWQGGGGIQGVQIDGVHSAAGKTDAGAESDMRSALDTLQPKLYGHWKYLLAALEKAKIRARPLGDHRIPLMAFMGLADPTCLGPEDWLALSEADSADFPSYAPAFRDKALAEAAYDRWWDRSNPKLRHRYLAGPMTYLSVIAAPTLREPWFERIRETWRRQHYQMFLLAHYQRAALLDLQDRIARAADSTRLDDARLLSEIEDIQRRMAEFSSGCSFLEVSPQVQGQELYLLLRKQLALDKLYDSVIDDKALLGNWAMAREAQRMSKRWDVINRWVIPMGLAFTFLGANVVVLPLQKWWDRGVLDWGKLLRDGVITFVFVAAAVAGARLYHWYLRRK